MPDWKWSLFERKSIWAGAFWFRTQWISYWCHVCCASPFMMLFSTSSALTSQYDTNQTVVKKHFGIVNEFIRQWRELSSLHISFCCSLQPCQQWEETQREAPVSSPSPSWETPMSPAPHLDAAMARCGALPPRAMMMTANGVSVLTKVWIVFMDSSCCSSGKWICHRRHNECQIV